MDEPMRRIVVTGARSPLGQRVLDALRASLFVEHVRGVVARASQERGALDFVTYVPDHRPFAEYLEKNQIDTVIQCDLVADRNGSDDKTREADVIAAMCLGAAIAREKSSVRNWILVSSSSIYPVGSYSALMQSEREIQPPPEDPLAVSIAEAEDYARDVARRMPNLNVAILRLQHLVGGGARGPVAKLLAANLVPTPIGFDPPIQLLHLEDAASAITFAARLELAGLYNVASAGLIHWHDAVRATGHGTFPVLPVSAAMLEPMLKRLGIPFAPAELLDLLRYGHVVDTAKIEGAGWRPEYDQKKCLKAIGEHRRSSDSN